MRVLASAICILTISNAAFAQQDDLLGGPFDPPVEQAPDQLSAPARSVVVVAPAQTQTALTPFNAEALTDARAAVPILATTPAEPLPPPPAAVAAAPPAIVAEAPAFAAAPPTATPARNAPPRTRRGPRPHATAETTLASLATPTLSPAPILDGPSASRRIGYGYNLCLDAQGGLRAPGEERAPALILWPCNGSDNQAVALSAGALRFSALQGHYVRPAIAPASGCTTHIAASAHREYVFRICAGEGAFSVDASNPTRIVFTSYAAAGSLAFARGAPLFVDRSGGAAPPAHWELVRRDNLLRVSGTDLCIAPPSQDTGRDAPLYLDLCSAPHQLGAESRDGAQRARATFVIDWR